MSRRWQFASGQAGSTVLGTPALWLEADSGAFHLRNGTTPSTDGQSVRSWRDQSANAFLLIDDNTEAHAPVLQTNVWNGHPALDFNGTDQYLAVAGVTELIAGAQNKFTIFVV